ncbi:MAG: DUF4126 domain-containing protein [Sandaracinus sp.]
MDGMDWSAIGTWTGTLALGIGLAAVAGIRAWLPLLAAGVAARLGLVTLGHNFEFVASAPALVLFAVATVVELVGDKFPAVDHALDAAGTVVRPAAGALLAAATMYQIESPLLACVLGLCVGAPTAMVPHATKAAARAASSTFTFGLANPMLSFAEDGVAMTMLALAFIVPALVVVAFVAGALIALWWIRSRAAKKRAAGEVAGAPAAEVA